MTAAYQERHRAKRDAAEIEQRLGHPGRLAPRGTGLDTVVGPARVHEHDVEECPGRLRLGLLLGLGFEAVDDRKHLSPHPLPRAEISRGELDKGLVRLPSFHGIDSDDGHVARCLGRGLNRRVLG